MTGQTLSSVQYPSERREPEAVLDVGHHPVIVAAGASVKADIGSVLSGLGRSALPVEAAKTAPAEVPAIIDADHDPDFALVRQMAESRHVVVVAQTSDAAFRLEATRAGANAVLWGPIDSAELGAWLDDFEAEQDLSHTVLIVDDDDLAASACAMALEGAGMTVHVVTEPLEAIDAVGRISPDLVLMDLHMPGANGLEIAAVLRQSRRYLSMPIIFLSAERDRQLQRRARRLGGDEFISKPIDMAELVNIVGLRAERAKALKNVMERDSLTGLLNHANFKDRVAIELARSARTGAQLSVCMVDLDHFKKVNDTYGHLSGDKVIQTLSHSLRGALRKTDVIARYGGEEFAVLLLDTAQGDAQKVIDRVREQFGKIVFDAAGQHYSVTLSAGLASARGETDVEAVLARADEALYSAKTAGRNQVCVAP